jgi:uncharacterized protein
LILNCLGKTDLKVSNVCFGTLTLSPLQKNLNLDESVYLLEKAYDLGINFFDTAELYDNYSFLKKAFSKNNDVIIASKSYSYDEKSAKFSLNKALYELDKDYIDIFLLHEQESELTLKGHREAIDFFLKKKQEGIIKAFGISTHHIKGVKAANNLDEIDVIHPIINLSGIGIVDGSLDEMLIAIKSAKSKGKGIYSMKPLGGGHLIDNRKKALDYVMGLNCIDSVAIGMQSEQEIIYNTSIFSGNKIDKQIEDKLKKQKRKLHIHNDWCVMCGKCIARCDQSALYIKNNEVCVDHEKCVLCSYCSKECSELAIKII